MQVLFQAWIIGGSRCKLKPPDISLQLQGSRKYIHNECLKQIFQLNYGYNYKYHSFQCYQCFEIITFEINFKINQFNCYGFHQGVILFIVVSFWFPFFSFGLSCFYSAINNKPRQVLISKWLFLVLIYLIIAPLIFLLFGFMGFQKIVKVKQRKIKIVDQNSWICRLCLQPENPSATLESNSLIIPCRCQGIKKYIHEQCLKKWIIRNKGYKIYDQTYFNSNEKSRKCSIECDKCRTKIVYELKNKIVFFDKYQMIIMFTTMFCGLSQVIGLSFIMTYLNKSVSISGQIWLGAHVLFPYPLFWILKYALFNLQYITLPQKQIEQHKKEQKNFTVPA